MKLFSSRPNDLMSGHFFHRLVLSPPVTNIGLLQMFVTFGDYQQSAFEFVGWRSFHSLTPRFILSRLQRQN